MDRFEAVVKVEEIIKYANAQQYDKALELLNTINTAKIRNYDDLVTFAQVYLKNKKYIEAKEILERIHQRTSTRRVLALLISVNAKMHNYVEAERCYEEYLELAPKDINRFILRYKIDKAKGLKYDVLIKSLEQLKEFDLIEEWEYELAKLYHKAGYDDKCISECNTIIMMFGESAIVEKAKLLRDYHIDAITNNTKYTLTGESGADTDFNATVKLNDIIDQVKEKMAQDEENEAQIETGSSDDEDYGEQISVSAKIEEEYAKDNDKISDEFIERELKEKKEHNSRQSDELIKQEIKEETKEAVKVELKELTQKAEAKEDSRESAQKGKEEQTQINTESTEQEDNPFNISKFRKVALAMTETSKLGLDAVYSKKLKPYVVPEFKTEENKEVNKEEIKEDEEKSAKSEELGAKVDINVETIESTKVNEKVSKKIDEDDLFNNLSSNMNSELDKLFATTKLEAEAGSNDSEESDESDIENISADDEDYYDVDDDDDDIDDDYDEDYEENKKDILNSKSPFSIINHMFSRKKEDSLSTRPTSLDELENKHEIKEDENLLEFEAIIQKEEERKAKEEEQASKEETLAKDNDDSDEAKALNQDNENDDKASIVKEKNSVMELVPETPIIPDYNNSGIDDEKMDEEEYNHVMKWLSVLLSPMMYDPANTEDIDEKVFRNFYDISFLRASIRCSLQKLADRTVKGNYIICGHPKSGKTTIAKMIAKTAYTRDIVETSKVARIDASKFNSVDLEYKQDKLADGCLIIQNAHQLTRAAMTSLITMIVHLNGRIVVFLETDYDNIAKLYVMTREVRDYFTNVIAMPEYNKEQLLGFAKSYAAYKNYSFSSTGIFAMEELIDKSFDQLDISKRIPFVLTSVEKAIRAAINRSKGGFGKPNADGLNTLEMEDVEQQYQ